MQTVRATRPRRVGTASPEAMTPRSAHAAPAAAQITRPFEDSPAPPSPRWTHRFRDSTAKRTDFELFDQIWLGLASTLSGAFIDRRTKKTKDGSDHDPAWVVLDGKF
jgi:hypothetical protein